MENSFSLKWNGFQSCAANSFKQLRKFNEFNDVTLVCDDYKQMSAHKLILSSCSTYFKTVLSQTNHPNPMICLDGISSQELNSILDYIYNGEVLIGHDEIDQFLKIAARLKLGGLSGSSASIKNYEALVTDNEKQSVSNECIIQEDFKDKETKHILPSKVRKPLTVDLKKGKKIIISSQKINSEKDANEEKYKKRGDLFKNNEEEDMPSIAYEYECIATEDEEDQETTQVDQYAKNKENKNNDVLFTDNEYENNTSVSNEYEFECEAQEHEKDLEKGKEIIISSHKFDNSVKDIDNEDKLSVSNEYEYIVQEEEEINHILQSKTGTMLKRTKGKFSTENVVEVLKKTAEVSRKKGFSYRRIRSQHQALVISPLLQSRTLSFIGDSLTDFSYSWSKRIRALLNDFCKDEQDALEQFSDKELPTVQDCLNTLKSSETYETYERVKLKNFRLL